MISNLSNSLRALIISLQSSPSAKKKSDTNKKKRGIAHEKKRDPSTDKKKRDLTDDKKRNPKVFRMFLDFPEKDKNKCGVDLHVSSASRANPNITLWKTEKMKEDETIIEAKNKERAKIVRDSEGGRHTTTTNFIIFFYYLAVCDSRRRRD
ncbi:unnamed protein product [Lactuca saligna]|uniref:Uncharacterized protein n=1 Tax=Lactuca saligna TaxID=75948 RepID=A0AA35ZUI5_LACSI|nr:unnamed protein product [Lactuca saligna]